jgi:hypothetical protein
VTGLTATVATGITAFSGALLRPGAVAGGP